MKKPVFLLTLLVLILMIGVTAGPVLAQRASSLITYDELDNQGLGTVLVNDVTFTFVPGDGAVYGVSPSIILGAETLDPPLLMGTVKGTLTLSFDDPVTEIEFGVGLFRLKGNSQADRVTVELFRQGKGALPMTKSLNLTKKSRTFSEGLFHYEGPPVNKLVIDFYPKSAFCFFLDNLKYHKGEYEKGENHRIRNN